MGRYIEKVITTNFEQDATVWSATNITINGADMSVSLSGWATVAGKTAGKTAGKSPIGQEHVMLSGIDTWTADVSAHIDALNVGNVYEILFEKILTEILATPTFTGGLLKTIV